MAFGESLYAGSLVILPIDNNMLVLMALNPLGKPSNAVSPKVARLVLFFFSYILMISLIALTNCPLEYSQMILTFLRLHQMHQNYKN